MKSRKVLRSTKLYVIYSITHIKHFFFFKCGVFPHNFWFPNSKAWGFHFWCSWIIYSHKFILKQWNQLLATLHFHVFTTFTLFHNCFTLAVLLQRAAEDIAYTFLLMHKIVQVSWTTKMYVTESYLRNKQVHARVCGEKKNKSRHGLSAHETTVKSLVRNQKKIFPYYSVQSP